MDLGIVPGWKEYDEKRNRMVEDLEEGRLWLTDRKPQAEHIVKVPVRPNRKSIESNVVGNDAEQEHE